MPEGFTLTLIAVLGLAVAFDYINGFHDTANAIAISVSTRALKPGWDRTEFRTEQTQRPTARKPGPSVLVTGPFGGPPGPGPPSRAPPRRPCSPPPCRAPEPPTLRGLGHRQLSPRERPAGGRAPAGWAVVAGRW